MKALIWKIGTAEKQEYMGSEWVSLDGWVFRTDDMELVGRAQCGWRVEELSAIAAVNELHGEDIALKIAKQLARGSK